MKFMVFFPVTNWPKLNLAVEVKKPTVSMYVYMKLDLFSIISLEFVVIQYPR